MISGRSRLSAYENVVNENPGRSSSVIAAPPTRCRCSSTSVRRPACARYAAFVRPLWPPPMTITSYDVPVRPLGGVAVLSVMAWPSSWRG